MEKESRETISAVEAEFQATLDDHDWKGVQRPMLEVYKHLIECFGMELFREWFTKRNNRNGQSTR